MTEHISPTIVDVRRTRFPDDSSGLTMECNTCGWYKSSRSTIEANTIATHHIRNWHGSGTIQNNDFNIEVTQARVRKVMHHE